MRYGVHNGFDAWRRLFNHYVPLAGDLQQIFIQELYDLKFVSEADVDKLFNDIQRISELYIRAGSESITEQWLVAFVNRNLLIMKATDLSMELRNLNIVGEIRNAINIYRHDHRTGFPRGAPGIMIAIAEQPQEQEQPVHAQLNHNNKDSDESTKVEDKVSENHDGRQEELNAVAKGGKQKGGKGYGQCWECGGWGHPRRECPKFLERMESDGGDVVAFKGSGKKGKKGKGKGGKGVKGQMEV